MEVFGSFSPNYAGEYVGENEMESRLKNTWKLIDQSLKPYH
jgi:hypothetical protein